MQCVWTRAATNLLAMLEVGGAPAQSYRARFEAIAETETAFNVFPHKIDCRNGDEASDTARIEAEFVIRISVAATDQVDLALDPLVLWAWRQVRGDPTLGGVVDDARVDGIEIGYLDKTASDQVCADMTIRVTVDVDRNDPSVNKSYPAI